MGIFLAALAAALIAATLFAFLTGDPLHFFIVLGVLVLSCGIVLLPTLLLAWRSSP